MFCLILILALLLILYYDCSCKRFGWCQFVKRNLLGKKVLYFFYNMSQLHYCCCQFRYSIPNCTTNQFLQNRFCVVCKLCVCLGFIFSNIVLNYRTNAALIVAINVIRRMPTFVRKLLGNQNLRWILLMSVPHRFDYSFLYNVFNSVQFNGNEFCLYVLFYGDIVQFYYLIMDLIYLLATIWSNKF